MAVAALIMRMIPAVPVLAVNLRVLGGSLPGVWPVDASVRCMVTAIPVLAANLHVSSPNSSY